MEYQTGAIKQDPASKAIAVRSAHAVDGALAWGVFDPVNGGYWATSEALEDWPDVPGTPLQPVDPAEAVL